MNREQRARKRTKRLHPAKTPEQIALKAEMRRQWDTAVSRAMRDAAPASRPRVGFHMMKLEDGTVLAERVTLKGR